MYKKLIHQEFTNFALINPLRVVQTLLQYKIYSPAKIPVEASWSGIILFISVVISVLDIILTTAGCELSQYLRHPLWIPLLAAPGRVHRGWWVCRPASCFFAFDVPWKPPVSSWRPLLPWLLPCSTSSPIRGWRSEPAMGSSVCCCPLGWWSWRRRFALKRNTRWINVVGGFRGVCELWCVRRWEILMLLVEMEMGWCIW